MLHRTTDITNIHVMAAVWLEGEESNNRMN